MAPAHSPPRPAPIITTSTSSSSSAPPEARVDDSGTTGGRRDRRESRPRAAKAAAADRGRRREDDDAEGNCGTAKARARTGARRHHVCRRRGAECNGVIIAENWAKCAW
mmetsp:Transcript_14112/g.28118  ORF Transcript_14112/g.28118 Transcript_14112/m.28118 type:complete len:109 (-) Transcript_14112:11-337(-)